MTEVVDAGAAGVGAGAVGAKKTRKNKAPTPIYRSPGSEPDRDGETTNGTSTPPLIQRDAAVSLAGFAPPPPPPPPASMLPPASSAAAAAAAAGQQQQSMKPNPYSDFMRSLAAKYNNNEYFTPTSSGLPQTSSPPSLDAFKNFSPFISPPFGISGLAAAYAAAAAAAAASTAPPQPMPPMASANSKDLMDQFSSTQALINLAARNAAAAAATGSGTAATSQSPPSQRVAAKSPSPLDLSGSPTNSPPVKRPRSSSPGDVLAGSPGDPSGGSLGGSAASEVLRWSVEEVAKYVESVELCKEYAEVFRDHRIDGSTLSMLTDDHLTRRLGMKLGPALKLRTAILLKMGNFPENNTFCAHCAHCQRSSGLKRHHSVDQQQQQD